MMTELLPAVEEIWRGVLQAPGMTDEGGTVGCGSPAGRGTRVPSPIVIGLATTVVEEVFRADGVRPALALVAVAVAVAVAAGALCLAAVVPAMEDLTGACGSMPGPKSSRNSEERCSSL